jgi:hypothetical protein
MGYTPYCRSWQWLILWINKGLTWLPIWNTVTYLALMIKGGHKIPEPGLPLNSTDRIKQSVHCASLSLSLSLSLCLRTVQYNRFGPFVIQFHSHCHTFRLYKIPSWLKGNRNFSQIQCKYVYRRGFWWVSTNLHVLSSFLYVPDLENGFKSQYAFL